MLHVADFFAGKLMGEQTVDATSPLVEPTF
jgi:hypothetical protein